MSKDQNAANDTYVELAGRTIEDKKRTPENLLKAIDPHNSIDRKRAAARESVELCKRIWSEAMSPRESFDADIADIDGFIGMVGDCILDPNGVYEEPEAILEKDGCPVFVRGDFSVIQGKAKSRKTFLSLLLTSLLLSGGSRPSGTPFDVPHQPKKLLYIDTEQGKPRTARLMRKLRRMNDGDSVKADIIHVSMRELGAVGRFKAVTYLIVLHRPDFVLIDGVADLMNDINSIPESAMLRQMLLTISSKYNAHICAVLHVNEKGGEESARGHIGSEVTRKCATVLNLRADGDISQVSFTKTRDKSPADFSIRISDNGLPELADEPTPKVKKDGIVKDMESLRDFCKSKGAGVQHKELIKHLLDGGKCKSVETAKHRIRDAVKLEYLDKKGEFYYPIF